MRQSTLHDYIEYPLVGGRIPRLGDLRVIIFNSSPDSVWARVNEGIFSIFIGESGNRTLLCTMPLPGNTPENTTAESSGEYKITVTWLGGDEIMAATPHIQIEPCKILWLNRSNEESFIESLETVTGLGFVPGEGLTVEGSTDRVFSGNPMTEDIPKDKGLYMLNGLSTRAITLKGSSSVGVDIQNTTITVKKHHD